MSRPEGNALVEDYLAGRSPAAGFYEGVWNELSSFESKAAEVDGRFDRAARERAAGALLPGVLAGSEERLQRWVEADGLMVTTGQQPGLFGGPLYSLYKGITAIRLARELEERLERPVLPVFWIASEDHDWEEANHTFSVDRENELQRLVMPDPGAAQRALHRFPLGAAVQETLDGFLATLPKSEFSEGFAEILRAGFDAKSTMPEAFRTVMEGLLGPHGMWFTDAATPALKKASGEVLLEEVDRAEELESILQQNATALESAGYETQVHIMPGGVNLFLEGPGGRERLYRHADGFQLHRSGEAISRDGIAARLAEDPAALSPNVLLRPVVESTVFPTVSYVAGPGEMAYYAQLREYFGAFGIQMPVIYPRHSALVVEGKIRKVIDKFHLELEQLSRPHHELATEIARDEVPDDVRQALAQIRSAVGEGSGKLLAAARAVDPTLKGPVSHARAAAFQAFEDAERKILHSVKRENEIALGQLEKAQLHLFPGGKPQERVLNPFYYLFRYGNPFLERLVEEFEVDLGVSTG